ncbi:hypothetical protein PybrP1_009485 [[Pythium] brassicae (nom. inval.)]|nr:hypothetical protein PybrP1_009485 [[Pythium] brassicae (nom. inval.)]
MDVYVRVRGAAPDAFEWQRARVLSRRQDTGQALVQLAADGRQLEANEACDVLPANTLPTGCASLADVTDLDALTHLHEASFVDYLRHRYDVDEVYCKSGAVLIAVNPFKAIRGLYDMTAYRERITGGGSGGAAVDAAGAKERTNAQQETNDEASDRRAAASAPLPPHVFSIAESAFRDSSSAGGGTSGSSDAPSLQLEGLAARDFQYTRGGSCFHRNDGVQDAAQFARVRESMAVLGFTPGEQDSLWRTLSALLHLGNVSFIPSTDDEDETNASALAPCRLALASPSQLPPETHLAAVARLLGVERAQFLSALTTRKISISGECFHVNLSQAQCSDARDAMARSLYGVLFQFLVAKINANAPQPPPPLKDSGADDPSSPFASRKEQADSAFTIHHYAGRVQYDARGFCEKNKDQPNAELASVLNASADTQLSGLFRTFVDAEQQQQQRQPPKLRRRSSVIGAAAVADASERVRALTQALAVQQVEVGRTRVFLRQSAFDELERRRDRLRVRSVVAIQSRWKARAQRLRYRAHVALVGSIQKRWRAVRELRRRKRRRDGAVKVLQAAARRWLAKQRVLRHAAARVLQRVVRVWEQKQAALRATLPTAISSSPSSSQSSAEKVEKRFGSVVELEAPPVDHGTERGSMASYSVETSSYYSEDPVDELELATRSSSNASLMFDEVARAPENLMLRQALEELERLRYRAEAAEAALLQMAASGHVAPGLGAIVAPPRTAIHDHAVTAAGRALPPSAQAAATATVDAFGNTALHQAVAHGDVARALALLTGDAQDADMVSAAEHQRGRTPLHVAVASGHAEMVGLFFRPDVLPRVDLDGSDRDGNTALHLAAQLAFELADRVMELLLCFGASPNAANDRKQTPLHLCAIVKRSGGSSAELMAKLLRHNADPQQRDALKRTPLHYCVESGMDEEAVLLMQHGADLNVPDADGVRVVTHPKATSLLRFIRVTPSWIPDADVLECMVCVEAFAFYSRKHHCDRCGRVCCSDCSSASSSWNGRFCFDCKHYQHAE